MWGSLRKVEAVFDEAMFPSPDDLRGSQSELPVHVFNYLSDVQQIALRNLESFGWNLAFIRRPLFVPAVVVVTNNERTKYAVLEEDGNVNLSPSLKLRH